MTGRGARAESEPIQEKVSASLKLEPSLRQAAVCWSVGLLACWPVGLTARNKHKNSTEHFWSIICPQTFRTTQIFLYRYLFFVVFCTEPYGHHREYVQTLCSLSVPQFLCIFCAKARIFFSSVRCSLRASSGIDLACPHSTIARLYFNAPQYYIPVTNLTHTVHVNTIIAFDISISRRNEVV